MAGVKPFDELKMISSDTLKVLKSLGYTTATPVQEACIPLFAGNKDVAVDACTGSGKTLAFVVPIVEKLSRLEEKLKRNEVGAVIVSPTRELARQIAQVAEPFLKTIPWLHSLLLVGGTDPLADVATFEEAGGNVLIGTPGRLADVMKRSAVLDTRRLEVLVLDEADCLLDMGFRPQLDFIMGRLPKQRRTGLFSATQTEAVEELSRAGLRNPVRVKVMVRGASEAGGSEAATSQRTPMGLTIAYRTCGMHEKLAHLLHFLQEHKDQKVIAYVLTCACVDFYSAVVKQLSGAKGLSVKALHGRMKQSQREATLAAFTSQDAGCLLCTDVAARGLDIPDVNWIVQLDAPQDPNAFVHRSGRTARMGRSGQALVFLLPHETSYVDFLRLRKVPLEEVDDSDVQVADLRPALRRLAESDRDVLEKGVKAFVSYVRGYKEHQCKYIFRSQDLDLGLLAGAFALLQLPKMPEIKKLGGQVASFTPSSIDPGTVKFKDKARQKARVKMLAERAKQAEAQAQERAAKRPRAEKVPQKAEKRLPAAKRRLLEQRQDVSDFADEYRLLKKLKRGKMTEHEFDVETGLIEEEEEIAGGAKGPVGQPGSADGLQLKNQKHRQGQPPKPQPQGRHQADHRSKKKRKKNSFS